jgi:hypothetical protein
LLILAVCLIAAAASLQASAAHPASAVSVPSPGLRLMASLDKSHLHRGETIELTVELKNVGASPLLVPGADRCNPALQLTIWGSAGRIAWAQGLPLCLERGEGPRPVRLAPGSSLSAQQCFGLAAGPYRPAAHCLLLELPAGTYQLGGSFHGMAMPRLGFVLVP